MEYMNTVKQPMQGAFILLSASSTINAVLLDCLYGAVASSDGALAVYQRMCGVYAAIACFAP